MRSRRSWFRRTLILACCAACSSSVVGQTSEASVEDVIQAVHSFQQLAILDPSAAGEVWMEGQAASDWQRVVEEAVEDLVEATILFGHLIPMAAVDESGVRAGLYNPWIGMLLLLTFDPLATVVESYSIHAAERLEDDAGDPLAFTMEAMSAADSAAAAFAALKSGTLPDNELSARDLGGRVDEATDRLSLAYGSSDTTGDEPRLSDAIDRLFAEELQGPLALLEEESAAWVDSLLPLWMRSGGSSTYVVLASMAAPLDWAWLEIGADPDRPIESVSVIRLYDRIVTQGRDGS